MIVITSHFHKCSIVRGSCHDIFLVLRFLHFYMHTHGVTHILKIVWVFLSIKMRQFSSILEDLFLPDTSLLNHVAINPGDSRYSIRAGLILTLCRVVGFVYTGANIIFSVVKT